MIEAVKPYDGNPGLTRKEMVGTGILLGEEE